jgi:hypothetical protein
MSDYRPAWDARPGAAIHPAKVVGFAMRARWPEYVITLCIVALGIAGAAAIWGPDAASVDPSSGVGTPMGGG